jgi:SAM-dependent methyltransferase
MSVYTDQKRYFEEAYRSGEHGWPTSQPSPFVVEFLRTFRKHEPQGRILDIGCGEGRHTLLFADAGYTAIGMDFQPLAIRRARLLARQKRVRKSFGFILGDVFALPFQSGCFDVIIDYGCLHHVMKKDFPRYLNNILPLLRPEGYFLLSCFSDKFKHHPGERRTRDWMVHRGHYDRFFRKADFRVLFGKSYDILKSREERDPEHPTYVFHHVLMRKKCPTSPS